LFIIGDLFATWLAGCFIGRGEETGAEPAALLDKAGDLFDRDSSLLLATAFTRVFD
jgi:hypothetical protein